VKESAYKIVWEDSITKLIASVNTALKEGWWPYGGLTTCEIEGKLRYMQAMVFEI
jgi:hypothetical protein